MIKIKRIYEQVDKEDGYRVLVDRLWPRGITKEAAALDEWNNAVAPTPELRQWFHHQPALFAGFKQRYKNELKEQQEELLRLRSIAGREPLTLLYAAKDPAINHAIVLKDVLESME